MQGLVRLVSASDLLSFPRPEPLIDGFIQEEEAVVLYGVPNGGKSFLALDWALCIATGKPWLDVHAVKQGPVLYAAGEGAASLQDRVHAWMRYHKIREVPGMYFQLRPLPMRDEETVEELQAALETFATEEVGDDDPSLNPRLIVVDTLSQFMMGGDEVAGPDMALFVANIRRLSQDNNTAVLIVHHTNASGERERGHTSLRGNVDVMFKCSPTYENHLLVGLELENDKQRDKARAEKVPMLLRSVHVGPERDSLVVIPTATPLNSLPKVKPELMGTLEAVANYEDPQTEKTLNTSIVNHTGVLRGTVHKQLEKLAFMGLVKHREGKSALTTLGRLVLDAAGYVKPEREDS